MFLHLGLDLTLCLSLWKQYFSIHPSTHSPWFYGMAVIFYFYDKRFSSLVSRNWRRKKTVQDVTFHLHLETWL